MTTVFIFKFFKKVLGNSPLNLYNAGAVEKLLKYFRDCNYYGLDIIKNYSNEKDNVSLMKEFYLTDLKKIQFSQIPDNYFDDIQMTHVSERLHNGDKVLEALAPKLKRNGYFCIECP